MSAMTQEVIVEPGTSPLVVDGSGVTQPVSGTVTVSNPGLTDSQLRATPVPVSGTVTATGPLTDTQLRATAVPVSGPLTDTQLRATPVPVSASITFPASSSATVTQITSNSSNQTLLAANSSRKKAILHFLNGTWDVKLGATASATSRTLRVSSAGFVLEVDTYTGIIDAICTTNGKLVDVTELA